MNYSYIFYRFDVIKMQIKHSSIIILLSGLAISPSVQSCKLYCLYIVVIAVHVLCIKTQLSLSTTYIRWRQINFTVKVDWPLGIRILLEICKYTWVEFGQWHLILA